MRQTHVLREEARQDRGSRRFWWAASAAWIAVILFSSTSMAADYSRRAFAWLYGSTIAKHLTSEKAFDWIQFIAEKCLHLTLFFVLGVLLWHVITAPRQRRLATVVLAGFVVGTASELLQRFFPDRDPAVRDVLINVTGTFLGASACAWRAKRSSGA